MSAVPTAELVMQARAAGHGVAAFNVATLEHAEGIVAAAEDGRLPVILQVSQNAVRHRGGQLRPIADACVAIADASTVPVALHLDHVTDEDLLAQAAPCGFSSAMFDAGARRYADNVAVTRRAVLRAHGDGVWLEAELGFVGGKPDAPQDAHLAGVRTDPREACDFVAATGVDALAVAVGSSHAMTARTATLDVALISAIAAMVPVPLVLHGSSGVAEPDLRAGIAAGLTKINIGTALNVALTVAVRAVLADPAVVDPRRYLAAGRDAVQAAAASLLAIISTVSTAGTANPAGTVGEAGNPETGSAPRRGDGAG